MDGVAKSQTWLKRLSTHKHASLLGERGVSSFLDLNCKEERVCDLLPPSCYHMEPEPLCQVRAETQSWDVETNWVWYNTVWIFKSIYNSEINPSIDVWNHLGGSVKWVKISFFFFRLSRFWLDIILLQTKQKILSAPPCSLILSLKNIFSDGKSVNWVTRCLHFCISYALTGQTLDKAKERRAKPKGSLPSRDRLGPVAVFAPGQISPWATKYKETTRD